MYTGMRSFLTYPRSLFPPDTTTAMASSTDTGIQSTPDHRPLSFTPCLLLNQELNQDLRHNLNATPSRKQSSVSPHPPRAASAEDVSRDAMNSLHQGTGGYEWLTIMAIALVGIIVQLLTSSSMASSIIPRIFLTIGLTFELVGVMLIICFIRFPAHHTSLQKIFHMASELPTFLILMGIMGITAAFVVEMLDFSIGTAIAMGCVLIVGVVLCFVALCFGIGGRAVMRNQA